MEHSEAPTSKTKTITTESDQRENIRLVLYIMCVYVLYWAMTWKDMVGVLQRKTVNIIKLAGEMGKLEREPVVDTDVKGRLRYTTVQTPASPVGIVRSHRCNRLRLFFQVSCPFHCWC